MRTNGRFEARVLLRLAILMHSPSQTGPADLALTENVSPRGTRVITKRPRKPGEVCELSALAGGVFISARVVYCRRLPNRNYCIGLELQDSEQDWWLPSRPFGTGLADRSNRAELDIAV